MLGKVYFTENHVAEILGVSLVRITEDRQQGKGIPFTLIEDSPRYYKKDIIEYMEHFKSHLCDAAKGKKVWKAYR